MRLSRPAALFLFAASVFAASFAFADAAPPDLETYLARSLPDNSEIRQKFFTNLITVPKETALKFDERVQTTKAGVQVLVRSRPRTTDFLIEFINASPDGFQGSRAGSYVIQREPSKGYILQAKVLLQDDPTCYARLYPQAEGTRIDVVMYGAVLKKGLYVSGLIYNNLTRPFKDLVADTKASFNWAGALSLSLGARPSVAAFAVSAKAALGAPAGAAAQAPAPGIAGREARLAAILGRSAGAETFLAEAATAGETAVELSGVFPALGLADDRDPLVVRQPYAEYPRYEPGKGLPANALRSALYFDARAFPDSVYALYGAGIKAFALPLVDEAGRSAVVFLGPEGEIAWETLAGTARDGRIRLVRLGARKD
ncbi:MAG: hypothetical protein JNG85_13570 [Spirochaetaceae bacterium]|nr:hypothetical protein [Spirochaetaceae bacterium]